jgi:diguanylate cyclase
MSNNLDIRELREGILEDDANRGGLAPGTAVGEGLEDSVTGLPVRAMWQAEMLQHLKFAQRTHNGVGVAMMDLDDFKRVNDTRGHLEGDVVLKNVGNVIKNSFRSSDIKGRYGGDEFIVMLTSYYLPDTDDVVAEAEKDFATELSEKSGIGVSVGVAIWKEGESLDDLIRVADQRLYRNKNARKSK